MKKAYHGASLEEHFSPGFRTRPAIHIGSQTMQLYHGDEKEQAVESLHIAAAHGEDVVIVRNIDPDYVEYWKKLTGLENIINLQTDDQKNYLSDLILKDHLLQEKIKTLSKDNSTLMVYFPTEVEEQLAGKLQLKLHGSPKISADYGTKSGIRKLALENNIQMPPGYVCTTNEEVENALTKLFQIFNKAIIKHDLSSAGRWMKVVEKDDNIYVEKILSQVKKDSDSDDRYVVEGWINSKASLCAHIEIVKGEKPQILAAWQQFLDKDNITYMGAGPLMLNDDVLVKFKKTVQDLADALWEKGAVGSFGPDFLIADKGAAVPEDEVLLLELNARVPFTAFPVEIVKMVKGNVGTGFFSSNIELETRPAFKEVASLLDENKLLISKRDPGAEGIVPFVPKLLDWGYFYYVAIGENAKEARKLSTRAQKLLRRNY